MINHCKKKCVLIVSIIIFILISTNAYLEKEALLYENPIESSLPVLEVSTNTLFEDNQTKNYTSAVINYYDENDNIILNSELSEIRYRGNTTFSFPKKAYNVKFTESINLIGDIDNAATEWVLLADWYDSSSLRNYMALSIADELDNIEYVTEYQLVELVLNNEHLGTYLLCECIEIAENRLNIDEETSILFELTTEITKSNCWFSVEDTSGDDIYFNVRSDVDNADVILRAQETVEKVETALTVGNKEEIMELIDIDSCIDMYLVQEVMMNRDVRYGSFYMYMKADDEKIYFGPPWDFDRTAGNEEQLTNGRQITGSYEGLYAGIDLDDQGYEWFGRLMELEWFQEAVQERWNEKKEDIYDVIGMVEEVAVTYESEFTRNEEIWGLTEQTYMVDVLDLIMWMYNRYEWLDEYYSSI